jgi:hypothetical protein
MLQACIVLVILLQVEDCAQGCANFLIRIRLFACEVCVCISGVRIIDIEHRGVPSW